MIRRLGFSPRLAVSRGEVFLVCLAISVFLPSLLFGQEKPANTESGQEKELTAVDAVNQRMEAL